MKKFAKILGCVMIAGIVFAGCNSATNINVDTNKDVSININTDNVVSIDTEVSRAADDIFAQFREGKIADVYNSADEIFRKANLDAFTKYATGTNSFGVDFTKNTGTKWTDEGTENSIKYVNGQVGFETGGEIMNVQFIETIEGLQLHNIAFGKLKPKNLMDMNNSEE